MGATKNLSEQMTSGHISGTLDSLPFVITLKSISDAQRHERVQDTDRLDAFNNEVKDWCMDVVEQLKGSVKSLVKQDNYLSESIKAKVYLKEGEAYRIGFGFRKEGIYIHKGAGRGHGGMSGNSKWTDKFGNKKKMNEKSFGLMGTGSRPPIVWFDPVVTRNMKALADIVANYSADMLVDATRILINK